MKGNESDRGSEGQRKLKRDLRKNPGRQRENKGKHEEEEEG